MSQKRTISCNQYPWTTFYRRAGRKWNLDGVLGAIARAGFDAYEPLITDPADLEPLGPLLAQHALSLPSIYVNSSLHEETQLEESIEQVLAIANAAQILGTQIVVTNPSPIRWGGDEDKNDAQLTTQALALDRLGEALRRQGMILAYHTHDPELRQAARELHHMLLATNPAHVAFCLDAHWIYRGAGNSQVALFDIVKLYGDRVVEVHLRQSRNGVWTEAFGDGDIDYARLLAMLPDVGVEPLLVMEQAVESGTPADDTAEEAHRRSLLALQAQPIR